MESGKSADTVRMGGNVPLLAPSDWLILANCVNEVLHGVEFTEEELQARIGHGRARIEQLLERLTAGPR